MESNESIVWRVDDVLLCYNNLIEVNCKNAEKVTVNYIFLLNLHSSHNWLGERKKEILCVKENET